MSLVGLSVGGSSRYESGPLTYLEKSAPWVEEPISAKGQRRCLGAHHSHLGNDKRPQWQEE